MRTLAILHASELMPSPSEQRALKDTAVNKLTVDRLSIFSHRLVLCVFAAQRIAAATGPTEASSFRVINRRSMPAEMFSGATG